MISADIIDGQIMTGYTETDQTEKTTGSQLGKDAFLQLLVTQMKYQDPLNPSDSTQMVSQLAQFSALEQMQNVASTMTNTQAMSLVGKNVIIEVGKSTGNATTTTVAGYVDYVQMIDGKAYLSIDDTLYSYDDFDAVVDEKYLQNIVQGEQNNKEESDKEVSKPNTDNSDKQNKNNAQANTQ